MPHPCLISLIRDARVISLRRLIIIMKREFWQGLAELISQGLGDTRRELEPAEAP